MRKSTRFPTTHAIKFAVCYMRKPQCQRVQNTDSHRSERVTLSALKPGSKALHREGHWLISLALFFGARSLASAGVFCLRSQAALLIRMGCFGVPDHISRAGRLVTEANKKSEYISLRHFVHVCDVRQQAWKRGKLFSEKGKKVIATLLRFIQAGYHKE